MPILTYVSVMAVIESNDDGMFFLGTIIIRIKFKINLEASIKVIFLMPNSS